MKAFFFQRVLPVLVLGLCSITYHPIVSAEEPTCLCKKATVLSGNTFKCDDKTTVVRLAGIVAHPVKDEMGVKAIEGLRKKVEGEGKKVLCARVKQQAGKPSLQTYFCTITTGTKGNEVERDLAAEMVMEGLVIPTGGEGRVEYVALGKYAENRHKGVNQRSKLSS